MDKVVFRQASLAYGSKVVLEGVNGSLGAGQALALIGPNGSGKTTLLRGLLKLARLSAGSIEILGFPPGKQGKGTLAYVPQASDLDPTFPIKVHQVVQMGLYPQLAFWQHPGRKTKAKALEALAKVGLVDLADKQFGQLSGGQQQRVLVARCLAGTPEVILLDEPFNGLDQPNRQALLQIISEVKQQGVSVIVSTHDLVIAREACEKVALLAGKQLAFGPRDEVLSSDLIAAAYGAGSTADLKAGI